MQWLIDVMKSRGKVGGIGLMILGLYGAAEVLMGKAPEGASIADALQLVFVGLGILGIRMKQD